MLRESRCYEDDKPKETWQELFAFGSELIEQLTVTDENVRVFDQKLGTYTYDLSAEVGSNNDEFIKNPTELRIRILQDIVATEDDSGIPYMGLVRRPSLIELRYANGLSLDVNYIISDEFPGYKTVSITTWRAGNKESHDLLMADAFSVSQRQEFKHLWSGMVEPHIRQVLALNLSPASSDTNPLPDESV